MIATHFSQVRKLLDNAAQSPDVRTLKGIVKALEKSVDELKAQNVAHLKFREEYARELIELIKVQQINVGPTQFRLQTVPYPTGKEKVKADKARKTKKRKKNIAKGD